MTDELEEIRAQKREKLMNGDEKGATIVSPVQAENAARFDELVSSHGGVLVDFYADWCEPCKMMEPAIQTVASETEAVVAKVNIDQQQPLVRKTTCAACRRSRCTPTGNP